MNKQTYILTIVLLAAVVILTALGLWFYLKNDNNPKSGDGGATENVSEDNEASSVAEGEENKDQTSDLINTDENKNTNPKIARVHPKDDANKNVPNVEKVPEEVNTEGKTSFWNKKSQLFGLLDYKKTSVLLLAAGFAGLAWFVGSGFF